MPPRKEGSMENEGGVEQTSKYFFFWKPTEENGWAGQWYRSPFSTKVGDKEMTFLTCEHWMMYQKAMLFGDTAVADEVMAINSTTPASMKTVKGLGRKVTPFDEERWNAERNRIVYEGNYLKFTQNEDLKAKLLATGTLEIVEASPLDRIWGIGFGAKNAEKVQNKRRWGMNLLGHALNRVRDEIRSLEQTESEDKNTEELENKVVE